MARIAALEAAGLLTWVHRLRRVREWTAGLPGVGATRVRVLRTSNAYAIRDPMPAKPCKSDLRAGTLNQGFLPSLVGPCGDEKRLSDESAGSVWRLAGRG